MSPETAVLGSSDGRRRWQADEDGVSAVIGTLLMLTITVVVFSALSIGALEYFDQQDGPARVEVGILRGDAGVHIIHEGGQALTLSRGSLILNVDGSDVTVALDHALLKAQTADSKTWRIGESLCLLGAPGSDCLYTNGEDVAGVLLVYQGRVVSEEGVRAFLPLLVAAPPGMRGRRGPRDDGVSSVVAAALVFALIITMTTLWSVQSAPDWVADREADHQQDALRTFASIRASLDTLSAAGDPGPVTTPVRMAPDSLPLLQRVPAQATLEVDGTFTATGSFPMASKILLNGGTAGEPTDEVDGDVHEDVGNLQSLILSLTTEDVGNQDEAWVQVDVTDGTHTASIRFTHAGKQAAFECVTTELRVEVTSDLGSYYTVLTCSESDDLEGRRVDALDVLYGFDAAVRALDGPLTMTLSDHGAGAVASAAYSGVWTDTSGSIQASQGSAPAPFSFSHSGKGLRLLPRYQELEGQELRLEGGAIIRIQDDGQVVASAPSFGIATSGSEGTISWTLVELVGTGSRGGSGHSTVSVTHLDTQRTLFDTPDGSITLTSSSADAWRTFLQAQVDIAGAGESVTIGGTGDTVTVELGGGPVASWRFDLRLVKAQVRVT